MCRSFDLPVKNAVVSPCSRADVKMVGQLGAEREPPHLIGRLARRPRRQRAAGRLLQRFDAPRDQ